MLYSITNKVKKYLLGGSDYNEKQHYQDQLHYQYRHEQILFSLQFSATETQARLYLVKKAGEITHIHKTRMLTRADEIVNLINQLLAIMPSNITKMDQYKLETCKQEMEYLINVLKGNTNLLKEDTKFIERMNIIIENLNILTYWCNNEGTLEQILELPT